MIRLVHAIRFFALVIVVAIALKGCGVILAPPFPCSKFSESRWQEFQFGIDTPQDVIATVVELWELERKHIRLRTNIIGEIQVAWTDEIGFSPGSGYSAWFREDRRLFQIIVRWDNPEPSIAQVIDCLGAPDFYEAYYEPVAEARSLELALWYVEKGLVVQNSSIHYRERTPAVSPRQRLEHLIVGAPGDLEEMVRNVYTGGDDPSWQAYTLCLLRPWPGSVEEIEVERFIESRRCGKS